MGGSRLSMPRWSVRSRILGSILLVTALGMLVAGGSAFLLQRERTLAEIDDRLLSRVESARLVVTGVSTGIDGDETTAAAPPAASFASGREALEGVLARVIPGRFESSLGIVDGVSTFVPGVAIDFHIEDDPALVERIVRESRSGQVVIGTAVSPLGTLRYVAVPIIVTGSPDDAIFVTAIDVGGELQEVTSSFTIFAIVAAAALVVIGLVGWFVAGRLLRPIRQLRAAASRITVTDLHERIPVAGRDDVSDLTETVNDMLDRLDASVTGQRRLLEDVRHELKTPITIVRGHLELLDPADEAEVASTRALAIDELDRMAALVDDIELLSQAHGPTLALELVDAADLTADVFAKAAVIPGREWNLGEVAHATARMDRARITQAWLQLADNAAKYSPDGSRIELGSTQWDDVVELWVSDEGPGIPNDARERIFERFGRVDTGRGVGGSGLGLPIVAAIADAHGGYVALDSGPGGSRFGIVLPVEHPVLVAPGEDDPE
jgi:signal transduction histidine kinase